MATQPRHTTGHATGPGHATTSPRASSAREDQAKRHEASAKRPDPNELQQKAAEEAHQADPDKNPPPQKGMSSSELNTAHPAMKEEATKQAEALPDNTDPKEGGVTDKQDEAAQKKFDKQSQ